MSSGSTIIALSSGGLPSGVAVIRLSGPQAIASVEALCSRRLQPRNLALCRFADPTDGSPLDVGLATVFPAPHSFTGEDCAELQVHGSIASVKAILAVLTRQKDVVLAEAGDFTRRAFENGKLDLTSVEGLGDLLAAETEGQRKQALARLEGGLSARIRSWRNHLLDLRAEIEAHLDFVDEDDVPDELPRQYFDNLENLIADIRSVLSSFDRGRITREGFRVVLAGAPNAGKSSLLNALAGSELAIVTSEAGTTRDTKDVSIDLGGQLVILTDTAGLRDTTSVAEAEGVRRAGAAMAGADLVLWLVAPDVADAAMPQMDAPVIEIATKSDLSLNDSSPGIQISAISGEGLETLISRIKAHMDKRLGASEPSLISHLRDESALTEALAAAEAAKDNKDQPELAAEALRLASHALERLVGFIDSEMVLDRLFAGFCIGK